MHGYEKLARFLAANRGMESYRGFKWLQSLNLLYLQAQLTDLEAQLRHTIAEDLQASDTKRRHLIDSWMALNDSKAIPGLDLQYKLMIEIRSTLHDYRIVKSVLIYCH